MSKRPFKITIGDGVRIAVQAVDNTLEITSKYESQPQINIELFSRPDEEYLQLVYSLGLGGLMIANGTAGTSAFIPCPYVEALLVAEGLAIELVDAGTLIPPDQD